MPPSSPQHGGRTGPTASSASSPIGGGVYPQPGMPPRAPRAMRSPFMLPPHVIDASEGYAVDSAPACSALRTADAPGVSGWRGNGSGMQQSAPRSPAAAAAANIPGRLPAGSAVAMMQLLSQETSGLALSGNAAAGPAGGRGPPTGMAPGGACAEVKGLPMGSKRSLFASDPLPTDEAERQQPAAFRGRLPR